MKYFAMIDGEQRGPYELDQLAEAGVRPSTYIWCKDMQDWEKAEDVADVCRMFRNRLYDLMHPTVAVENKVQDAGFEAGYRQEEGSPSRFDRQLNGDLLPSLEEIDARTDINKKPANMVLPAVLATLFFFPPLGIFAIYFAIASKRCWRKAEELSERSEAKEIKNEGNEITVDDWRKLAHEYSRAAKMWTGITFFIGLILYGFIFSRLI